MEYQDRADQRAREHRNDGPDPSYRTRVRSSRERRLRGETGQCQREDRRRQVGCAQSANGCVAHSHRRRGQRDDRPALRERSGDGHSDRGDDWHRVGVAVGGAVAGIGTTLGMLPLMTTAGIDGNVPVAAVVVVDDVDVDAEDVVASDELAGRVVSPTPLQPSSNAINATEERMRSGMCVFPFKIPPPPPPSTSCRERGTETGLAGL